MRYLTPEILRFLKEEKKMALIAGPRQTGKTTLAKSLLELPPSLPGKMYFNWDIESHRRAILKNPESFWDAKNDLAFARKGPLPRLVLDEIHKYPRWKRFLKGLYDAVSSQVEIVVTGSGRLDVYQRGGDSLFGRYGLYHLHPFTLGEFLAQGRQRLRLPEEFWRDLFESPGAGNRAEEALRDLETLTGFPEPLFSSNLARLRRWRRARNHLVIREDLRDITRIRDIGLVESLALLLPERVGSPLSLNSLSEDLGVAFGTVRVWIETLCRLYYAFEIRPYSKRVARALRREAKIYLFDFSEIADAGARFENVLALHLLKLCEAWNDWGAGDFALHYVRDKEKREVDFLIVESGRPYALLEAKLSDVEISPALRRFRDILKPAHCLQIVRQSSDPNHLRIKDGIILLAASRFLSLC